MKCVYVTAFLSSLFLLGCNQVSTEEPIQIDQNTQEFAARQGKEVYLNSTDIVLKKGKIIPKGTFILKEDETQEDYLRSGSGPLDLSSLTKTATSDVRTVQTGGAYHRIYLIAGNSSSISCAAGDDKVSGMDLNRGAGGKYIYLCGATSGTGNIRPSSIRISSKCCSNSPPPGPDYGFYGSTGSNGDMNQGAGGKYINGYYDKWDGSCGISGIGARFEDHWWEFFPDVPFLWHAPSNDPDLNDGAGGAWIHFVFYTSNQCWG